jgi:hypothetical protein
MIRKPKYDWIPTDEHFPDYFWPEEICKRYDWTRQACHLTAKRKNWGKLVSGRNVLYKATDVIQFDRERRLKRLADQLAAILNAELEEKKQQIRKERGLQRVRGIPRASGISRLRLRKTREVPCPECGGFAYKSIEFNAILCEQGHQINCEHGEESAAQEAHVSQSTGE